MCPNVGHSAPTSSFPKYVFLQVKNSFVTIVNGLTVWNCFNFRMVIYYFISMPTASTKWVNWEWRSKGTSTLHFWIKRYLAQIKLLNFLIFFYIPSYSPIDGSFGSKTVTGVLLAHLKREGIPMFAGKTGPRIPWLRMFDEQFIYLKMGSFNCSEKCRK